MIRELALALLHTFGAPTPQPPDGGLGSASVQVALIGGAITLLSIYVSAAVSRTAIRRRRHAAQDAAEDDHDEGSLVRELRERAARAEAEADTCIMERRRLREFVVSMGYDADTLHRRPRPQPEEA